MSTASPASAGEHFWGGGAYGSDPVGHCANGS